MVAQAYSGAGVPAQDRVVVSRRPNRLGPLVICHRLLDPLGNATITPGSAPAEPSQAAPLANDARVVQAFVLAVEPLQQFERPRHTIRAGALKLVRQREQ